VTAGLVVDLFAGGGGASVGIEAALGRPVDIAINHDDVAIAVHRANHPETRHLEADIWEVRPVEATGGRPVDLLWASPDCTHFSQAKGDVPRRQDIRSLAWAVVRWAAAVRPRVICLENVQEFQGWGPLVDWSLPCPSIFERRKPLAEKTLWRIAQGIRRFVLEAPAPFVIRTDHHQSHATNAFPIEDPLGTITSANGHAVVAPSIVKVNHGKRDARGEAADEPLTTITATQRGHALVAPTLIQTGYGERPGQAARVPGLHKPLGTMVNGQKHALVAAFLARHFGGVVGAELPQPIHTITARDHHSLAAATLVKLRGDCNGAAVDEPVPTVTASGMHVAEVRAFLTAFYGSDGSAGKGQSLRDPARTITARHRLGLVTVEGTDYQIVDIGMRMLEPHELLRAQFGRFAEAYDLSAARTRRGLPHKGAMVRLIGNSVCPEVAEAVVRANAPGRPAEVAA